MTSPARLTDDALRDIQGIITSGYGHLPYAAYLFVTMTSTDGGRRWLSLVENSITSSQHRIIGHGLPEDRPSVAVNLGLSAEGLRALGLPQDVMRTFPVEFQDGIASEERSRILGDTGVSAPETWEIGGPRTEPVHAMLMLFAPDESALDELCRVQRDALKASGGAIELPASMQRGYRPDTFAEPFGFHDGIAQPSIAGLTGHGVPTGEFILGYENHYGLIPPTPVVPREMNPANMLARLDSPYHAGKDLGDLGRHGSYLVYRKLQQDVAGFWQFMKREASRARGGEDPAHMVWLASRLVGRWPSGAPIAVTPDTDSPRLGDHDEFLYKDDPDGFACPLGAHVRRVNPRDVIKPYGHEQSLSMSEAHRLLRRGRVFGPPLFDPQVLDSPASPGGEVLRDLRDDGEPRGIHFLCVNASIKSQFEFVQQTWCNNPRFSGLHDNKDPIAGNNGCPGDPPSHMTIPGGPVPLRTAAVPRFVTVKGGAYLFMPSLAALRFLASFRAPV